MKVQYRQFSCNKCGAIHSKQTNHKGTIYNQKCKNWSCTPGMYDYTTMSFYVGEIEERETNFYTPPNYSEKTKLFFKKGQYHNE